MNIDNQLITADSAKRWIEMLQKQLIRENPAALPNDGIDGIYGAETAEWVTRFQERKGLYVDGIAGAETLERLRTDIVFYVGGPSGRGVELLQEDLEYFYLSSGTIDGIYGAGTRQSVRDFQSDNGLFVDGEAGPGTLKKMDELLTTLFTQPGDTNSLVRRVQEQLNEQESISTSVYVDGIYGSETKNAITQFQEANDLYVDGIAGPRTMRLLNLEADPFWDMDRVGEELGLIGIGASVLSSSDSNRLLEVLQKNAAYTNRINYQVETALGAHVIFNEQDVITLYVQFNNVPNIQVVAIYSLQEELVQFTIMDAFGGLYTDTVTFATFDVEGNSIEEIEYSNVELENIAVEIQNQFQDAVKELSSTSRMSVMNTRDYAEIAGILGCSVIGSLAGTWTANALVAAFALNPPAGFALLTGTTIGAAIGLAACPAL